MEVENEVDAKAEALDLRVEKAEDGAMELHVYPLRSRIREEKLRKEWEAARNAPRTLDQLPVEVLHRIVQYLNIQDLCRIQMINRRLRCVSLQYLSLVKRINFSNGLPFAFISEKLDDEGLKCILARTPEVTHILGFYPRRIYGGSRHPLPMNEDGEVRTDILTYTGIIEAFKSCAKLRSVEIMDEELMSQLVFNMSTVKFHGMFRNRPDSWDSEYAVEMPQEPGSESRKPAPTAENLQLAGRNNPYLSCVSNLFSTLKMASSNSSSTSSTDLAQAAATFAQRAAIEGARKADWFEPVNELPLGQGCPITSNHPAQLTHSHVQRLLVAAGHQHPMPAPVQHVGPQQQQQPQQVHIVPPRMPMPVLHHHDNAPQQPNLLPLQQQQHQIQAVRRFQPFREMLVAGRDPRPMVALAIAAAVVPPDNVAGRIRVAELVGGAVNGQQAHQQQQQQQIHPIGAAPIRARLVDVAPQNRRERRMPANMHRRANLLLPQALDAAAAAPVVGSAAPGLAIASPLPHASIPAPIILPKFVSNLTKLDLVSVAISTLPRLDNIKYLHLKWVCSCIIIIMCICFFFLPVHYNGLTNASLLGRLLRSGPLLQFPGEQAAVVCHE